MSTMAHHLHLRGISNIRKRSDNTYQTLVMEEPKSVFLDRNLDTSQPSGTRDPAPPLLSVGNE
jgi:hypothetical protein